MRYSLYPQADIVPTNITLDLTDQPLIFDHIPPLPGYRGLPVPNPKTITATITAIPITQDVVSEPDANVIHGRKSLSLLVEQFRKGKQSSSAKSVSTACTSEAVATSNTSPVVKLPEARQAPTASHQKSKATSATHTQRIATQITAPQLPSNMASRRSTLAEAATKPLVLNATPALEPLPGRSPFDKSDPGAETPTRRARASTAAHASNQTADLAAQGYSPTSFSARTANLDMHGWPLTPTQAPSLSTSTSRHGSASSETSSLYENRPLPPIPTDVYLKRVTSDISHNTTPVRPSEQPMTPARMPTSYIPAANSIQRSKSLERRRRRLAGRLAVVTPSTSTPGVPVSHLADTSSSPTYSSSIDDLSPVSPPSPRDFLVPSYPPPTPPPSQPHFSLLQRPDLLSKLDFCPTNNCDKRNLDWELASSIRTSEMSFCGRSSFDMFSTPRSSAGMLAMDQHGLRECRKSRSIATLRRPSQPTAAVPNMPTTATQETRSYLSTALPTQAALPRKPLSSPPAPAPSKSAILVAVSEDAQTPTERPLERQGSYWLPDEDDEDEERRVLRRPRSLPIWRKVKAGLHLDRILRPRSLGRLRRVGACE